MSTNKSEFRVFSLRGLPSALLGTQSFAIAAATEIEAGKFLAEYHVLTYRPKESLKSGSGTFDVANLPVELGSFDLEAIIEEARSQIEIDTSQLLEERAVELGRPDLTYQPFNYAPGIQTILSAWMRGFFIDQINTINQLTICPKLKLYLGFVVKNEPGKVVF